MRIEDQVVSLELSKKLKTLGINNKSYFFYEWYSDQAFHLASPYKHFDESCTRIPAYTAAELFELLPNTVTIDHDEPFNNFRLVVTGSCVVIDEIHERTFIINFECDSTECTGEDAWLKRNMMKNIWDANLANALAKTIIYLVENNLLTIEDKA